MQRVPVQNPDGSPAMPCIASRARRWVKLGLATEHWSPIGVYYVKLIVEPSGRNTQPIAVGIDPGLHYTGIAVQSAKHTLFLAHLVLPFQAIKERMEQRKIMRRSRRGRRINRKVPYKLRAHRQKRFDNRRQKKVPPSIRANRLLELRTVKELQKLYPLSAAIYEVVVAKGNKGFSPVMVGQYWMLEEIRNLLPVEACGGWKTANTREHLGLTKQKTRKGDAIPETHAVDGVALAANHFIQYRKWYGNNVRGAKWFGSVQVTAAPFFVIRRPPISRRQLHLMIPAKGGIRRKYGGTTTRHGFRKSDFVKAEMAGRIYYGWVSGDTERQVSVSDINWKRLGQFTASKVQLIRRSTGLLVERQRQLAFRRVSNP